MVENQPQIPMLQYGRECYLFMRVTEVGVFGWQVDFLITGNWGPGLLLSGGSPLPSRRASGIPLVKGGGDTHSGGFLKS